MAVSGVQNAQAPGGGGAPSPEAALAGLTPKAQMGKEDFLKLLVAQLSHQDPQSPSDPTQFVAQLSQFSSLEQLTNIKSGLDTLAVAQTAGTSAQVVSFIGKTVAFDGQSVVWNTNSPPVTSDFSIPQGADKVSVSIVDAQGREVDKRDIGKMEAGSHEVVFDGKKVDGTKLPAGTYSVKITATAANGDAIEVTQRTQGLVTGVTFEAGYPQLVLQDGRTIGLAQISEVLSSAGASTAADATNSTTP